MIFVLLLACGEPSSNDSKTATVDPIDERIQDGDLENVSADDVVFYGADVVIEPFTDTMWCLVGTYTGPDVALHEMKTYQGNFGHHFQIMGLSAGPEVYADGELIDCSATGALPMADLDPLMLPTASNRSENSNPLPDGMAYKLRSGQRYVLQSHYVNTGEVPTRVRDVVVNKTVPIEEVVTWTAPLVANRETFSIEPGQEATVEFDCSFKQDYNFVYAIGHMHEWGKAFRADVMEGDVVTNILDVPAWDPSFRDNAPVTRFDTTNPFVLKAGSKLHTSCTWFNDTDEALEFPHEMCVTVGMVYPSLIADVCSD